MKITRRSALLLPLALGLVARTAPARAQDVSSPTDLLALLDGLEAAPARVYVDASQVGLPTPDADPAPVTRLTITVLVFRDADAAKDAYRLAATTLVAGALIGAEPSAIERTERDDLGDNAVQYLREQPERHVTNGLLLVLAGEVGYIIQGLGEHDGDATITYLDEIAAFLLAQDAPTAPVTVVQDGTASGGWFDVMPGRDDEDVLQGLLPTFDYDLLVNDSPIVAPDATPEP